MQVWEIVKPFFIRRDKQVLQIEAHDEIFCDFMMLEEFHLQ